jgi:hypothetical protein
MGRWHNVLKHHRHTNCNYAVSFAAAHQQPLSMASLNTLWLAITTPLAALLLLLLLYVFDTLTTVAQPKYCRS